MDSSSGNHQLGQLGHRKHTFWCKKINWLSQIWSIGLGKCREDKLGIYGKQAQRQTQNFAEVSERFEHKNNIYIYISSMYDIYIYIHSYIYIHVHIYVDMPIFSYYPITITKNYTVVLLNHSFVRFSLKIRSNNDSWPGAGRANQFLLRQNFALLKQHLCGWAAFGRKQSQSQQVWKDCFIPKLKMLILGMQNQWSLG